MEVNTFISKTKIKQINSIREAKHNGGMYMKSFVTGLEEVLDEYRSKIVEVEQDLIQEPNTPLSHLLRTLNTYTLILPNLATLVYEITLHGLYGGPLLDALYKHSCTGIAAYKDCVDKYDLLFDMVLFLVSLPFLFVHFPDMPSLPSYVLHILPLLQTSQPVPCSHVQPTRSMDPSRYIGGPIRRVLYHREGRKH